ncbi:hypothetical protein INT47_008648 [Mucor saturninus]|uniref:Mitochondrial import inner membrane translocase subunit TIM54 n=1 Tax=Mucor saturninus TaxID=64648 RepID=A0A8H7QJ34_9FUNG|nr:hypothetical protein INT47_008648 [Mucor saturninus]
MPFGLKVPSKNTLIFRGVAGGFAGLVYSSNKYAQDARTRLAQRVSFLADRLCGVHEMPRTVTVYITAPPGDGLEKSRTWFREYVKPILVAGAVDYEIKEAKSPGQIETSVMEEIIQRRPEQQSNAGFTSTADNMNNKKKSEVVYDGILATGRNAGASFSSEGCREDKGLDIFCCRRNLGNVKSHIIQEFNNLSLPLEFSHTLDIPE